MPALARTVTRKHVHGNDRRANYTSRQFAKTLTKYNLRHSVGRTGICYDNAMAESFFAALKKSASVAPSIRPVSMRTGKL
jgi:putative transposase